MNPQSAFLMKWSLMIAVGVQIFSSALRAHCDSMDGPVVKAAVAALERKNVDEVLAWVSKKDEAEVRQAFQKTLSVRKLNADSKELADRYFFETAVRLHRMSEGMAYTGLKPAGLDWGPAIPAAEAAVEKGSVDSIVQWLNGAADRGLRSRFDRVMSAAVAKTKSIEARREFVRAYVAFIHTVERIYEAAAPDAERSDANHEAGSGHH